MNESFMNDTSLLLCWYRTKWLQRLDPKTRHSQRFLRTLLTYPWIFPLSF